MTCWLAFSSNLASTTWRSRTRARRTSIRKSSNTVPRSSSSRAQRRSCWTRSHLAKPIYSSDAATWSPCATARPPHIAVVRERCESCPTTLSHGEDYILYAILDFIVDNYMPVVETIQREVDAIEDRVFTAPLPTTEVQRLYIMRRELLQLRNAAAPLAEVCRRLEHAEVMQIDKEMQPLFRDVTDHVNRIKEEVDALREVLAFTFEASLMVGQTQQTAITRQLAAWAAILAVPTAIAGIYGMNFEHMPELKWRYGYYIVLGLIVGICGTIFWRLRRNGWL